MSLYRANNREIKLEKNIIVNSNIPTKINLIMKCKENSHEAIINCLILLAVIDDDLDPSEEKFIEDSCRDHNIRDFNISKVYEEFSSYGENYEQLIDDCLEKITDFETKKNTIDLLNDLSLADENIDQKEIKFINRAIKKWQLEKVDNEIEWDEKQKRIINKSINSRTLVISPPGCGKTAVACKRVAGLIENGCSPNNILVVSFTRSAVKEIKDRIEEFFADKEDAIGLKIATLDATSWSIMYGLSEDDANNFFGSYDSNIEEVSNKIESGNENITGFFSSFKHLVIDEAQDLVGVRSKLVLNMMSVMQKDCGVTIFADPAQAIYDFTNDDLLEVEEKEHTNFIEEVSTNNRFGVQKVELKNIYRTNANNLITLVTDLRKNLMYNEKDEQYDKEMLEKHRENIFALRNFEIERFNSKEVERFYKNGLIIFRKRSEALFAYHNTCVANVRARLRIGNMPHYVLPWIARTFKNTDNIKISFEKFSELVKKNNSLKNKFNAERTIIKMWNELCNFAREDEYLNLTVLKSYVSRPRPPVEISYPDLTDSGPIIGTIHASKGREADTVLLLLNEQIGNRMRVNYKEEGRIQYVGATRAKEKLVTGPGFLQSVFSTNLMKHNGTDRTIWPNRGKGIKVEIGRNTDIDNLSLVKYDFNSEINVKNIQTILWYWSESDYLPIEAEARLNDETKLYELYVPSFSVEINGKIERRRNYKICQFSEVFSQDMKKLPMNQAITRIPPHCIYNIYIVGIASCAIESNDQQAGLLHEPYSNTGFWLTPIVRGFPSI